MLCLFSCATRNIKIQECLFCNVLNRLQKLIAEFSGDFDCSCFSVLLYVAYYALQSVLQPLYPHAFIWMQTPKLVCVQFFNQLTLKPAEAKGKEVSIYTSVLHFSNEKERKLSAYWNLSLTLLVRRVPRLCGIQSSALQEPKSQTYCCKNGAEYILLIGLWYM